MIELSHWIDGQPRRREAQRTFDSLDPTTDRSFATAPRGEASDVDAAVASAVAAGGPLAALGPSAREAILIRAADLLEQRTETFRELLIGEIGSPLAKADMELSIAGRLLRAHATMARRMTGRTYASDVPGRWSVAIRRPLGVVASITPFNVPLIKGVKQSSMPLVLGNPVVWLPSPKAPAIADQVARLYHDAGLGDGALNVVFGMGHEIGDPLIRHRDVRGVCFTGSAEVGRSIQATCGAAGKRVTLELGGKNPIVVLEDADLDRAVEATVRGGFIYQGQICMASSRVLVHRKLFEIFTERLVAAATALRSGPLRESSTMIGPIIDAAARTRISGRLQHAVDRGARILCGNRWQENCLRPTVITDIDRGMEAFHREWFGPVVEVAAFEEIDQALEEIAQTPAILSASVFTRDLHAALDLAERLPSAMVHINDMTIQQEPEVPFGGDGDAGFGREGMQTALDDFTTWKWITLRG